MYKISQEELKSIVSYLVTKPYNEVAGLIQIFSQLELINHEEEKAELIKKITQLEEEKASLIQTSELYSS